MGHINMGHINMGHINMGHINMPATSIVLIGISLSITIIVAGFIQYASAFVNIVSPEKGEAVPAGSSLTVSGTSDDNAQTNCNIQIIVDDTRPYQDTIPVAPGDYSEWTFVVNPQYAEIEEGINTITSKATCDAPHEPFLKLDPLTRQYVKHYSINVTGVPSGIEGGVDSEEPFAFPAPEEDSGDETGDGGEDEESTSDESLFG
jgi:hypothetical protein